MAADIACDWAAAPEPLPSSLYYDAIRRLWREYNQQLTRFDLTWLHSPDPALGECDVLGNSLVEVVAHHEHVEVLVDRVCCVRPSFEEEDHNDDDGGVATTAKYVTAPRTKKSKVRGVQVLLEWCWAVKGL